MSSHSVVLSLGSLESRLQSALSAAEQNDVVRRIWSRDPTLWINDEAGQKIIRNSLGWLTVAEEMDQVVGELHSFARTIASEFTHVMVCGMGGSSLCPEVLAKSFGKQPLFPELLVLDSTDPDYIAELRQRVDPSKCLFIIASKSGTTTEPLCFYKYWFNEVAQVSDSPGNAFVLITDPGTPLVEEAHEKKFRRVFLNQADIGGRYSALSYFGMVPAALMGLDVGKLLGSARAIAEACGPDVVTAANAGVLLGAAIGECAKAGRDKLTLLTDRSFSTLGLWIEQLVAESTGKQNKGVLPVAGEPLGPPEVYGDDRLFVEVTTGGKSETELDSIKAAGHPVITHAISDLYDLGGEFFLWEFATAFAGWCLQINPFDQPDVQSSKDATKRLLQVFNEQGKLPQQTELVREEPLTFFGTGKNRASESALEILRAHLSGAQQGDYFAFLTYVEETQALEELLQSLRTLLRDRFHIATTTGYGPRFLHSTGQLHKGGPNTGVFMQLTAPDKTDLAIPGEDYSFSILKQAQALGDFEALATNGRRAIRIDLGDDALNGLRKLEELIRKI
jgi:transaldolase / glucose-6-phosphate isomerase